MKTNSILKRGIMSLLAFTMLFTAMFGFSATKASAAQPVRVISDAYATAYINENGSGYIELHKTFTKDDPLTSIDGVKLYDIIRFGENGFISQFYTYDNKDALLYDHGIYVYGHGPENFWRSGHLCFDDESVDEYNLQLWVNKYGSHTVDYNSDKPTITTISWWTTD